MLEVRWGSVRPAVPVISYQVVKLNDMVPRPFGKPVSRLEME